MAKEAAARTVELLREDDTFGLIAFDSSPREVVPLAPLGDKATTIETIRSLTAGGGTEFSSSLQLAYNALFGQDFARKHIVLLTDGQAAVGPDFYSVFEKGLEENITLTTVAIGQDADRQLLEQLAREGGGNFYDVADETTIPAIFSRETIMLTRTYIVDNPFYPVLQPVQPWTEIFRSGMPRMNAYVATTPKTGTRTIMEGHEQDPILIQWQYGLGTTIAFTSDVTGKWSGQFPASPVWPKFIVEMVTDTLPKFSGEHLHVELDRDGKDVAITLKTRHHEPVQLDVSLVADTGTEIPVYLKPVQPGVFQFSQELESGLYFLNSRLTTARGETLTSQTGFSIPYSDEFLLSGTNEELLQKLTQITGGKILQQPGDAFRKLAKPAFIKTSCSLFLTVLAFLLFWLDIVLRRFGMMELVATLPKSLFIRQKVWNEKSRKIFLPKRRGTFEKNGKKAFPKTIPEPSRKDSAQQQSSGRRISNQDPSLKKSNREEQIARLLAARDRRKKRS